MIFHVSFGDSAANTMPTEEQTGRRKKTKRPSASHKTKSLRIRMVPKPSYPGGSTIKVKKSRPLDAFAKPPSNKS